MIKNYDMPLKSMVWCYQSLAAEYAKKGEQDLEALSPEKENDSISCVYCKLNLPG